MAVKRILFVHNAMTSFVRIDMDILSRHYEVEELYLRRRYRLNPFAIWRAVSRNDLVFAWFASWHSLLPVCFASLQHTHSVLITGGYDTANVPLAGYGNQRNGWKRIITNFLLHRASRLICNSNYASKEAVERARITPEKISMVYHGIPDRHFPDTPKKKMALNVGNVLKENLKRKGIEPFLAAGALLPSYLFIQVGQWKDDSHQLLKRYLGANVELRGFVSEEELNTLFSESRVYIQPSLHEAFGLSVVEAMQAGCIPLVSRYGALPEVVGEFGILLDDTSPEAIVRGISEAENCRHEPSDIRQFVLNKYTIASREEGLLKCIGQLASSK
ncbi:glycosyltransferase family 4 protein [Flavitalea sp. BT771]|uniref:glycosyltransferase family 4 protein n=1 Tax=Flavitalea sp. BT771 TaxID=3063329 RepID=UPI0026E222B3|nr:glycosyltransferase family 4 protein [Flavitalea sp. BT771]MDO6429404.1 glycosyltransferase family 4 protein [Flavitalea sp. BT771]MDV6218468.1 glycosyltransferase family 4 protein [Flavitalea sp. BT771]